MFLLHPLKYLYLLDELSDYFFKKGVFINAGAYLDSLIQLMDKNAFITKITEREREGLDRIINLETIMSRERRGCAS